MDSRNEFIILSFYCLMVKAQNLNIKILYFMTDTLMQNNNRNTFHKCNNEECINIVINLKHVHSNLHPGFNVIL